MLKNQLRSPLVTPNIDPTATSPIVGIRRNEKIMEASINPTMNLGNLYQISNKLGFSPGFCYSLRLQYMDKINATAPISTFCESLTTAATAIAVSLNRAPAATTAPVVSIVPPSQAPATEDGNINNFAMKGSPTSIAPSLVKATTEGKAFPPIVVPSALGIITDRPPIITAAAELLVPRSIPIILAKTILPLY